MTENNYESLQEIVEHENKDYPLGVYYVEPGEMFMEHVRWHWHTEIEIDLIKEGCAEYRIGEKPIFSVRTGESLSTGTLCIPSKPKKMSTVSSCL